MPFYAKINSSGCVCGVSETKNSIDCEGMIPIESLNIGLMGKSYNADTSMFTETEPQVEAKPFKQKILSTIKGVDFDELETTDTGKLLVALLCLLAGLEKIDVLKEVTK